MEFVLGLIVGSFASLAVMLIQTNNQNIITSLSKSPICVESTVGKDNIKKCYELVEIKEK